MKLKKYILIATGALCIAAYTFCLPRKLFSTPVSSVLLSSDGLLMGARAAADGQWRFPPSESIPDKFAQAIICYEDKRFRHHPGVDAVAVARALKSNLGAGKVKSGASTITMQVIRLSRPDKPRSIGEKILEAIMATRLELRCGKDEILRLYADNAPFGGNVVGIQAAAWRYWGRSADELSWAEAATLAVLPNSPALIHPGRGREKLLEKRNFLLGKLYRTGKIDSLEYSLSMEEPLPDKPLALPDMAHHYLESARNSFPDRMIRSSLDYRRQAAAERILDKFADTYSGNKVYNMAAVILDVKSGEPIVYCGNVGAGSRKNGCDVDVAVTRRSSGSTLKPLLYAGMLDRGMILPGMLVADTPFHLKDFSPSNYSHSFDGAVTAESVIQRSLNVPSVRMLQEYGIAGFIDLLGKCGFTTIDRGEDTYGLSLILGGAEIKLMELATCYRNMACCLRGETTGFPIGKGAVWCTFEALKGVTRPEEEGSWQNFSSSRDVAWKTGTSYGNRDAWSVGITRDYVVAVWVGNCNGEGRPALTGVGYAAPVMFELFGLLDWTPWFDKPYDDLHELEVCSQSGHPCSAICPAEQRTTVWVPRTDALPPVCPYHRTVHLSQDGRYQVDSGCYDATRIRNEVWFVLPPSWQWYFRKKHPDYRELPPFHPDYSGERSASAIQIIYPQAGMSIVTPLDLDGKSRGVVFSAAHVNPGTTLFWHLDSDYLGSTSNEHKLSAVPAPGEHRLIVTDSNGNSAAIAFTSK